MTLPSPVERTCDEGFDAATIDTAIVGQIAATSSRQRLYEDRRNESHPLT